MGGFSENEACDGIFQTGAPQTSARVMLYDTNPLAQHTIVLYSADQKGRPLGSQALIGLYCSKLFPLFI